MAKRADAHPDRDAARQIFRRFAWTLAGALAQRRAGIRPEGADGGDRD